ncbi:hypothetical protein F5888DRAFT_1067700 [Russula emetica]|nr:hypothetical protein F5888DRAFT_1067700 [Russula emetica]
MSEELWSGVYWTLRCGASDVTKHYTTQPCRQLRAETRYGSPNQACSAHFFSTQQVHPDGCIEPSLDRERSARASTQGTPSPRWRSRSLRRQDCLLGLVEVFICFECCKGCCECVADIVCCPCEMCC